jgi:membrane-anchored protein YejM (alkaline phosphatase superfamily)
LLESVRYDLLKKEVNGKTITPNLNRWIAEGALAPKHAYSSKGFTSKSVTEIFWGNYYHTGSTLVDDFKDNHYDVCIYSSEDEQASGYVKNNHLDRADVLFDMRHAPEVGLEAGSRIRGTLQIKKFEEYLDQRDSERPFFAYFYFYEAHFPYTLIDEYVISDKYMPRSEIGPDNLEKVRSTYYNQVYHADKACGDLVGSLARRGLDKNTTFFFISDHGESLYDDGRLLGHGIKINDVMNHCALVIKNATTNVSNTFLHSDMRSVIRDMLTRADNPAPKVIPTPERKVFHYLTCMHSPSCIGEFSESYGRLVYDFINNEIRDEKTGKRGRLDEKLDPELRSRAYGLIRRWEYLKYANRNNVTWYYE